MGTAAAAPNHAAAVDAGPAWKIQSTPDVTGAAANFLDAVSCPSVSACFAVGNYQKSPSTPDVALTERWTGTKWELQSAPTPAKTAVILEDVSCVSASDCTAVGWAAGASATVTLAERWNGKHWAIQSTPNPHGAVQSFLYGVSCSAAAACTAVGYHVGASGPLPLAERWNGKQWAIQTMPTPHGAQGTFTTGVSCPSATACTAVGYYNNSKKLQVTLAERWNGKQWAIQATPNVAGAASSYLYSVSCPTLTACTASDFYFGNSGSFALAEHWNGAKWVIQTLAHVAGNTILNGVSCRSATACTAVGWTTKGVVQTPVLAEHWNGKGWAAQTTQNPSNDEGTLAAVSCPTVSTCFAVGSYVTSSGRILTLAEHV